MKTLIITLMILYTIMGIIVLRKEIQWHKDNNIKLRFDDKLAIIMVWPFILLITTRL